MNKSMRSFKVLAPLILSAAAVGAGIEYQGHTYLPTPAPMSWQAARVWADQHCGYLVSFGSREESDWVRQNVGSLGPTDFWIGLSDSEAEGIWLWESGEPVGFTDWKRGEPNNFPSSPSGEDFAAADAWSADGSGWVDWPSPVYGGQPVLKYGIVEIPFTEVGDGDLNASGTIDGADLGMLLSQWGTCGVPCSGDLDGDSDVDGADLGLLLSAWTC